MMFYSNLKSTTVSNLIEIIIMGCHFVLYKNIKILKYPKYTSLHYYSII